MWFMASVHAYDVMSQVHITASVRGQIGAGEQLTDLVLATTTTIDGVGESDPRAWLEDVLVGLLEAL